MIWIVNAQKAAEKYEIQLEFNDGLVGTLDFQKNLENDTRSIVRELLNTDNFNSFGVMYDTVTWENGVDFAPDFLHRQLQFHLQVA